jgi:hypothetical protein
MTSGSGQTPLSETALAALDGGLLGAETVDAGGTAVVAGGEASGLPPPPLLLHAAAVSSTAARHAITIGLRRRVLVIGMAGSHLAAEIGPSLDRVFTWRNCLPCREIRAG